VLASPDFEPDLDGRVVDRQLSQRGAVTRTSLHGVIEVNDDASVPAGGGVAGGVTAAEGRPRGGAGAGLDDGIVTQVTEDHGCTRLMVGVADSLECGARPRRFEPAVERHHGSNHIA